MAWQIVFTFLPVVNFWAFYRIRKLRKFLLYVFVPSVISSIGLFWYISERGYWVSAWYDVFSLPPVLAANAIGLGLQVFAVYLVIVWSRAHNRDIAV
jgi:hypothetical protein